MLNDVSRHLQDHRPEISSTFDSIFGGPGWRREVEDIMAAGQSREDAILEVFRERLRNFGSFSYVTSTRVLNPLSDRSYFHLVYGTRHWKGLVEFRHVEKKAVDVQEGVRDAAKLAGRMERTGQRELFGPGKEQTGPRFYEAERQKQLDAGFIKLCHLLKKRLTVRYDDLLGELLELPLVWKSDLNKWLDKMHKSGEVNIPDLRDRERVPKPGYLIHWRGKPANGKERESVP